jgi:hypothetical protein
VRFFYTSVDSDPIYITFNRSIPFTLLGKVVCAANIPNIGASTPGYTVKTNVIENYQNQSYVFECIFNVENQRPGIRNVSLRYTDSSSQNIQPFIYSSNSLQITFVG